MRCSRVTDASRKLQPRQRSSTAPHLVVARSTSQTTRRITYDHGLHQVQLHRRVILFFGPHARVHFSSNGSNACCYSRNTLIVYTFISPREGIYSRDQVVKNRVEQDAVVSLDQVSQRLLPTTLSLVRIHLWIQNDLPPSPSS